MKWYAIVWRRVHYRRERERETTPLHHFGHHQWRTTSSLAARRNFIRIRASFVDSINFTRSLFFSLVLAIRGGKKKGKSERKWSGGVMEHVGQREKKGGKWTIVVAFCRESGLRWDTGSPAMVSISSSTRVSFFSMYRERGREVDTFQFNFCPTHRGKVLYLDIGLQEFSTRFSFTSIPHNGTIRARR